MSSAKADKPAPRSRPVDLALAPVDNTLLANLCGALDENIRQIETAFDVAIARPSSISTPWPASRFRWTISNWASSS